MNAIRTARPETRIPARLSDALEFEEIDDYAGDLAGVQELIERQGMLSPDFGFEAE